MSKKKKHPKKDIRQRVDEYYGVSFKIDMDWEQLRLNISDSEELDEDFLEETEAEEVMPESAPANQELSVPWIPDKATYNEIQKLIAFVDFVSALEETSEEDRKNADEVKRIIENIDKPDERKDFCVTLDIVDWDVQLQEDRKGVYRRQWWLFFDPERMSIEVETIQTENPVEHWGPDFYYYGMICFTENEGGQNVYLDKSLGLFVDDALNFRSYMTETMREVETQIEVRSPQR